MDFLLKPQKSDVLEVRPTSQTEGKTEVNLPKQSRELNCHGIKAYLPVIELLSRTKFLTFQRKMTETTVLRASPIMFRVHQNSRDLQRSGRGHPIIKRRKQSTEEGPQKSQVPDLVKT